MIPRIAVCLTSYDRIDCTRINQEIFKLNFTHSYIVVHASSGITTEQYLEDVFVHCEPKPHFSGAINNMQNALKAALPFEPDFLIILDGDTWMLNEQVLIDLIRRLETNPSLLMATTSWSKLRDSFLSRFNQEIYEIICIQGNRIKRLLSIPRRLAYDAKDFSVQFFILRNYNPLINAFLGLRLDDTRLTERQWFDCFSSRFSLKQVLRIKEREPVHPNNRHVCEQLGLFSQHWPAAGTSSDQKDKNGKYFIKPGTPGKREVLERHPQIRKGDSIQKLLNSANLDYYNIGAKRY